VGDPAVHAFTKKVGQDVRVLWLQMCMKLLESISTGLAAALQNMVSSIFPKEATGKTSSITAIVKQLEMLHCWKQIIHILGELCPLSDSHFLEHLM
jgi:hypothetical protein